MTAEDAACYLQIARVVSQPHVRAWLRGHLNPPPLASLAAGQTMGVRAACWLVRRRPSPWRCSGILA